MTYHQKRNANGSQASRALGVTTSLSIQTFPHM